MIPRMKFFLLPLLFLFPVVTFSQTDVIDDIASAFRSGNSKQLAQFFDQTVDITILDQESAYSKVQAEMVLRDFFSKNAVQGFELQHRGTNAKGSMFGIGRLTAGNQHYRASFFVRQKNGAQVIEEIRIEKQQN
jgi:hypothetical protein